MDVLGRVAAILLVQSEVAMGGKPRVVGVIEHTVGRRIR